MKITVRSLWVSAIFGVIITSPVPIDDLLAKQLINGAGYCYVPVEAFEFHLPKSDPIYEAARDDHQRYLEELEQYIKCLDEERLNAVSEFKKSFRAFQDNYGQDAVFRYKGERTSRQN